MRAAATSNRRIEKADTRAERAGMLAKNCEKARALFLTGADPQASYGHSAQGVCPTQTGKIRAAAIKAVGGALGAQPCATTVLHMTLGKFKDPAISKPTQQIRSWMAALKDWAEDGRQDLEVVWRKLWVKLGLEKTKQRWQNVAGPLSATIATLADHGWAPIQPAIWLAPNRTCRQI